MNMSELLTRLKIDLGIYSIALPFENPNTMIEEIIQLITLPVFSIYEPFRQRVRLNLQDLKRLEKRPDYEVYLMPDFGSMKLLYIEDIQYDQHSVSGFDYWNVAPIMNVANVNQAMVSTAGMLLSNKMIPRITFKFEAPKKVTIWNAISTYNLNFDLAFTHDTSLGSIPDTAAESFYQLAVLDVKKSLYNALKHYDTIETAYGRITLKIDDWQNAEQERKELLSEWDSTYHLDGLQVTWA